MSFVAKLFSKPKEPQRQAQSAPVREQAQTLQDTSVGSGSNDQPVRRKVRRRGGTQTRFGGVLGDTAQASQAKKSLLGE